MEKDKKVDLFIKISLVIIIILLLLYNYHLIKKANGKKAQPNGNVEIIEIQCDDRKECPEKEGNKEEGTTPGEEGDSTDSDGDVIVSDDEITWDGSTSAKIFTNSMYDLEDVIAPESSNTYKFIIKNSTKYNVKYGVYFQETNLYNINMKYKLKKNDTYLVGDYVSASELNFTDFLLNSNEGDTFYLEWKWISSSNDTEIGLTPDANYKLQIEVKAESVNG